jgi:hypothetical protein
MSRSAQDVLFVLLGVGGLVLKGQYSGPADDLVHSYGGNIAASFAVYFLAKRVGARSNLPHASPRRRSRSWSSNCSRCWTVLA